MLYEFDRGTVRTMRWLMKAVSKDDFHGMNVLRVINTATAHIIEACDGFRAHVWDYTGIGEVYGIDSGSYKVKIETSQIVRMDPVETDKEYPDFLAIFSIAKIIKSGMLKGKGFNKVSIDNKYLIDACSLSDDPVLIIGKGNYLVRVMHPEFSLNGYGMAMAFIMPRSINGSDYNLQELTDFERRFTRKDLDNQL